MLVGPCGFGVAADGGCLTISGNNGATIVSDMAHIMGPLAGSGGGFLGLQVVVGLHHKVSAALFGLQMAGSQ